MRFEEGKVVCLAALCAGTWGCVGASKNGDAAVDTPERFSFFVTSYAALQRLSGSQEGFGGDLRFGETGPGAGLRGADKICATIAESSLPGAGFKQWRAFLSASDGGEGEPVHAIDRIGDGPWYDRVGRLFGNSLVEIRATRPTTADIAIQNDFPNEDGIPNHQPDPTRDAVDNHDMLTGTDTNGQLYAASATCLDWTSAVGDLELEGRPRVGHSWGRGVGGLGGPGMGGNFPGRRPFGDGGVPPGAAPPGTGFGGRPPFDLDGGVPGGPNFGGRGPNRGAPGLDGGAPFGPGGGGVSDVDSWMSSLTESGCKPGANLIEMGGPQSNAVTVGSGGGYGGFYCFALTP
jgi:hypothetical protein